METFSVISYFSIFSLRTIDCVMRSPLLCRYFDSALKNAGVLAQVPEEIAD
jgi:hypothetical protein